MEISHTVPPTLYTDGDIEVLGTVKGDITAKGKVKIGNVCASNIKANTLEIFGGEVTGDVNVTDTVYIGKGTKLCGNITAQELVCAGVISGNITVTQGVTLEATAKVTGDVTADSISIAKGAFIRGGIEIKSASVGKIN